MQFLYGKELSSAIRQIASSNKVSMAVAFWGHRGEDSLPPLPLTGRKKWRIVCNLKMGGTNPKTIAALQTLSKKPAEYVRHHPRLHAKVYLSNDAAIVGSANVSANGLGLEGKEVDGWVEAGLLVRDATVIRNIQQWFDELWDTADPVTARDLSDARKARAALRSRRPSPGSLQNLDPNSVDVPLLAWFGNSNHKINEPSVRQQMGSFTKELVARIDNGTELEGPNDLPLLGDGRWILTWFLNDSGKATNRPKMAWVRSSGQVVRNAYSYTDEPKVFYDAVLASSDNAPPPFDLAIHAGAIIELLNEAKYSALRDSDHVGEWFHPRLKLTRQFWRDLQRRVAP